MKRLFVSVVVCLFLGFMLKSENENKTEQKTPAPPFFVVSNAANTNAIPLFQNLNIDPEQHRKNMQYRTEYDRLTFQIAERTQQLFQENEELRKLRQEICELQEKIEQILKEDKELQALYEKQKNLIPPFPAFPPSKVDDEQKGEKEKKDSKQ